MIDRERETAETAQLARKAAELGREDAVALSSAGFALGYVVGDIEDGDAMIDRALKLNPNLAWAWYLSGWVKVWLGEPEVAIERTGRALRLSPLDPYTFLMQSATAYAHFISGRYADAASWAEASLRERPDHLSGLRVLAASSAMLGRQEQARKAMKRARELDPTLRLSNLDSFIPLRRAEHRAMLAKGLEKAGLPQ
jgi:tetratricopeptide (TPR) repeat protein